MEGNLARVANPSRIQGILGTLGSSGWQRAQGSIFLPYHVHTQDYTRSMGGEEAASILMTSLYMCCTTCQTV